MLVADQFFTAETLEQRFDPIGTGAISLPGGRLVLTDRAIRLSDFQKLRGHPDGTSVLVAPKDNGTYGDNCCVKAVGDPFGYAEGFTPTTEANTVQLRVKQEAVNYVPGEYAYAFRWNGYANEDGRGQVPELLRIGEVDPVRGIVSLSEAPKEEHDTLKWLPTGTVPVTGAVEGSDELKVGNVAWLVLSPGRRLLIGSGPYYANEFEGEWRTVVSASGGTILLDYPLRQTHLGECVACPVNPVTGFTVENVTLEAVNSDAMFCKFATNYKFSNVYTKGKIALGNCFNFLIEGSKVRSFNPNCCHGFGVEKSQVGTVFLEERTFDGSFDRVQLGWEGGVGHGIVDDGRTGCERIRINRGNVTGSGRGTEGGSPITLTGRECQVHGTTVTGTDQRPGIACWFRGSDSQIVNVQSDAPLNVMAGVGWTIRDVIAPGTCKPESGGLIDNWRGNPFKTIPPGWVVR